ncbi:hypothetical protein [Nocardia sp. NPDC005745]|uniref:hypothetical protein n=1 Tax=Nocardia sp. NPDC005745 TaxID=3157061 RepID=UPI0033C7D215
MLSTIGNGFDQAIGAPGVVSVLGDSETRCWGSGSLPARPKLAPNLSFADQDLGKRLLNRAPDAPWWTLRVPPMNEHDGYGVQTIMAPPSGSLEPILIDHLGQPVVAAWLAPNRRLPWYIVPDAIDWNSLLDWLIQRAIPQYAPEAARRIPRAAAVDPTWQTSDEIAAHEAVTAMAIRHDEERTLLHNELDRAKANAAPIRDALLYGVGDALVGGVQRVLRDAGLTTNNLDIREKGTWSADLLAYANGRSQLVEVKSARGHAGESLVGDLMRHLDTWRAARPDEPVTGGTLIVNHEYRAEPDQRNRQVYRRPEFIAGLTVHVVSTLDLFQWWKAANWAAIRSAVLGTASPNEPNIVPAENTAVSS